MGTSFFQQGVNVTGGYCFGDQGEMGKGTLFFEWGRGCEKGTMLFFWQGNVKLGHCYCLGGLGGNVKGVIVFGKGDNVKLGHCYCWGGRGKCERGHCFRVGGNVKLGHCYCFEELGKMKRGHCFQGRGNVHPCNLVSTQSPHDIICFLQTNKYNISGHEIKVLHKLF